MDQSGLNLNAKAMKRNAHRHRNIQRIDPGLHRDPHPAIRLRERPLAQPLALGTEQKRRRPDLARFEVSEIQTRVRRIERKDLETRRAQILEQLAQIPRPREGHDQTPTHRGPNRFPIERVHRARAEQDRPPAQSHGIAKDSTHVVEIQDSFENDNSRCGFRREQFPREDHRIVRNTPGTGRKAASVDRKAHDLIEHPAIRDKYGTAGRELNQFLLHRPVYPVAQQDRVRYEGRPFQQDSQIEPTLDDEATAIGAQSLVLQILVVGDPGIFEIIDAL